MQRLQRYRSKFFLAAIGGGVIPDNVQKYALKHGLFVVVQTGESITILKPQDGQLNVWLPN